MEKAVQKKAEHKKNKRQMMKIKRSWKENPKRKWSRHRQDGRNQKALGFFFGFGLDWEHFWITLWVTRFVQMLHVT